MFPSIQDWQSAQHQWDTASQQVKAQDCKDLYSYGFPKGEQPPF